MPGVNEVVDGDTFFMEGYIYGVGNRFLYTDGFL